MGAVTITVDSTESFKQRVKAAFAGKRQYERISFESVDLLWKVLAPNRMALVQTLTGAGPVTLREAARRVSRDVRAVHSDVHMLLQAGVLRKDDEGRIEFPYTAVHVDFMLKTAGWALPRLPPAPCACWVNGRIRLSAAAQHAAGCAGLRPIAVLQVARFGARQLPSSGQACVNPRRLARRCDWRRKPLHELHQTHGPVCGAVVPRRLELERWERRADTIRVAHASHMDKAPTPAPLNAVSGVISGAANRGVHLDDKEPTCATRTILRKVWRSLRLGVW